MTFRGLIFVFQYIYMLSIFIPDSTSSVLHAYTGWNISEEYDPLASGNAWLLFTVYLGAFIKQIDTVHDTSSGKLLIPDFHVIV